MNYICLCINSFLFFLFSSYIELYNIILFSEIFVVCLSSLTPARERGKSFPRAGTGTGTACFPSLGSKTFACSPARIALLPSIDAIEQQNTTNSKIKRKTNEFAWILKITKYSPNLFLFEILWKTSKKILTYSTLSY
jgi:hypothetical protein